MEVSRYFGLAEHLRSKLIAVTQGLPELTRVIQAEAERLQHDDQVRRLERMRADVQEEVDRLLDNEAAAASRFYQGKLTSAGVKFAIGSLTAGLFPVREHPFPKGMRMAADSLAEKQPFGQVRIAMDPWGIPGEVNVIPVSRWSREQGVTEAEVVRALESRGYRVFDPESIDELFDELKEKVQRGTLTLPSSLTTLPPIRPPHDVSR